MERQDGLPDAQVPEAPFQRRGLRRADAILRERRVSDASGVVRQDEAVDALILELADARCVEKLAGRVRDARVRDAKLLRAPAEEAAALCTRDAVQFAA
jgi:hypothetical protein